MQGAADGLHLPLGLCGPTEVTAMTTAGEGVGIKVDIIVLVALLARTSMIYFDRYAPGR